MTAEERRDVDRLLRAVDAIHSDRVTSALNDIADVIKPFAEDFRNSEHDEMDELLGEIYRESLRQIFKILKSKGVNI